MNKISKNNCCLIFIYLIILAVVLTGYLFMVAFNSETYDSQIYKNAYVYYIGFQFLLFSIMIPYWDIEQSNNCNKKIKKCINNLIQSILLSASAVPLILVIFIVGNLNFMNFFIPIILQIIWGVVILSFKDVLGMLNLNESRKYFCINIIVFMMIIISLVFFYYYHSYGQLVVTTIYDKDIPRIFFLNPLLTILGYAYMQAGSASQMGTVPVIYLLIFYVAAIVINSMLIKEINIKKRGRFNNKII